MHLQFCSYRGIICGKTAPSYEIKIAGKCRKSLNRFGFVSTSAEVLTYLLKLKEDQPDSPRVVFLRHAERDELNQTNRATRDAEPINENGQKAARAFGKGLRASDADVTAFLWMGSGRTRQTAEALRQGYGAYSGASIDELDNSHIQLRCGSAYEQFKQEVGWNELVRLWLADQVDESIMMPCKNCACAVLERIGCKNWLQ